MLRDLTHASVKLVYTQFYSKRNFIQIYSSHYIRKECRKTSNFITSHYI